MGNLADSQEEYRWAKVMLPIVKMLCEKRLLSRDPNKLTIIRVDREPIHPCAKSYGSGILDLSQLEWAYTEGKLWFSGPIKSLETTIDSRRMKGQLSLEPNVMTYTTSPGLGALNRTSMEESAKQFGMQVYFDGDATSRNTRLMVTIHQILSIESASEFIDRTRKVLAAR